MEDNDQPGDTTPTAAVGSKSPILTTLGPSNREEPTFSMDEVMRLVTSITKHAASSAVTAALTSSPAPSRDRGRFYLPPFDPDVRSHDIRDWCANIDETIETFSVPPLEARMKAILQLKGRAKVWADTWSLQSTTWEQVKEELIQTFGKEFRYADDVQKWRSYTSDQAASYAEYATTGWTLFKRVRPEASDAEIIDALITGIYPEHVRSELLRNTPDSLPKLVSVLKTYRKRKFDNTDKTNTSFSTKKPRSDSAQNPSSQQVCYKCNKSGHVFRNCRETVAVPSKPNVPTKLVECNYCHKKGHVENNCYRKQYDEKKLGKE